MVSQLVLSLFPGIGLLDRGFEAEGFCVVRSPDLIWGGDIRHFYPPPNKFDGVIGGSPCQDFSVARRTAPTGNGVAMLGEFVRVVEATRPAWWLLENVPAVPDVKIAGYNWQRLDLRASEFGLKQRRLRHIQFGSRDGKVLILPRNNTPATEPAILATDNETPWDRFCVAQGLPPDFDIPSFTVSAKRKAVGNGVPLPMAKALAKSVRTMAHENDVRLCACRCGRPLSGKQLSATPACRKRLQRRRRSVTVQRELLPAPSRV